MVGGIHLLPPNTVYTVLYSYTKLRYLEREEIGWRENPFSTLGRRVRAAGAPGRAARERGNGERNFTTPLIITRGQLWLPTAEGGR